MKTRWKALVYEKLGCTPELRNESQSESYEVRPIGIVDCAELRAATIDTSVMIAGTAGSYMLGVSLARVVKSYAGLPITSGSVQNCCDSDSS